MTGIVDIGYSIERFINLTFGTNYEIAYGDASFHQDDLTQWVHLSVIGPTGRPSRGHDYSADVRISLTIHNRTSQRLCQIAAQVIEASLRGGTIPVYDESGRTTQLGEIRLQDPDYAALGRHGNTYSGVLQVAGIVALTEKSVGAGGDSVAPENPPTEEE